MDMRSLVLQILFLIVFGKMLAFGFVNQEERKCKYLRAEKMLKIRCYDMNLKEVPQYLKTSVEVLDLSFNRIKKLKKNSFQQYKNVKYLLLYENMIQFIEPGTFTHLTSLQEIDLSNNALMSIPLEIFQLPSLRNLYVDSNELINLEKDLEGLRKPIDAPLEYLNVADCGLTNLPDLGILPKMWHINASLNPLTELNMDRFANWCHLKSIDLMRTSLSPCACQQVTGHLRNLNIKMQYVPICPDIVDINLCPLPSNLTSADSYRECLDTVKMAESRNLWLFVAGCFGGAFLVLLIVYYCMHRSRKKRAKKKRATPMRKQLVISPKNAINNHNHNNHNDDDLLDCDTA